MISQLMNDRQLIVYQFVVNALADGYENLECILELVAKSALDRNLTLTRDEVVAALERAIREGCIQAYLLSPVPPYSQVVTFSPERIDAFWFYITPEGERLLKQLTAILSGLN